MASLGKCINKVTRGLSDGIQLRVVLLHKTKFQSCALPV